MTLSIHSPDCLFPSLSQRIKDKLGLKLLFCVCTISSLLSDFLHLCDFTLESLRVRIEPPGLNPSQNIPKLSSHYAFSLVDFQNIGTLIKHCTYRTRFLKRRGGWKKLTWYRFFFFRGQESESE